MEMSKGEFATHIGVSPGRVSQMITSGMIGKDALVGEGRSARVLVEAAVEQIRKRRDVGQALGNGLGTRLTSAPAQQQADAKLLPRDPDTTELIALERLATERRRNRLAEIDEAERMGRLVPAEDMQREVGKVAQRLVNTFTGMVPDIANAIAAEYSLPARDLVHLIRRVMNEKRADAAQELGAAAAEMPDTVEVVVS